MDANCLMVNDPQLVESTLVKCQPVFTLGQTSNTSLTWKANLFKIKDNDEVETEFRPKSRENLFHYLQFSKPTSHISRRIQARLHRPLSCYLALLRKQSLWLAENYYH